MLKKTFIAFLIIIIFSGVFLAYNGKLVLKYILKESCENIFGVKVKIDDFSLDADKKVIAIQNAKIYNPKGFPDESLIDIEQLVIDYDLSEILKARIKLNLVVFNIRSCTIIRNSQGELNVNSLKNVRKRREMIESGKKISERFFVEVEVLSLSIGRVVYKVYKSAAAKPRIKIYEAGIRDKIYKDIPDARDLSFLILTESLKRTAISRAEFYTIDMLESASSFPFSLVNIVTGKDSSQTSFAVSYNKAYNGVLEVLSRRGVVTGKTQESLKAKLKNYRITVNFKQVQDNVQVTVYARKVLFSRPGYAKALLCQVAEELNK